MDHYEMARAALAMSHQQPQSEVITAYASQATGHAVLALIDIITGDREDEINELHGRIADLESMLSGCREALRQRELAIANSMKQQEK